MQTDASIWYYVLHQSSTITRFREVKRGSKTRPLDTQAHHGTRGTGASPVTRQWRFNTLEFDGLKSLPAVEHSPGDLPRVPLQHMGLVSEIRF